MTKLNVVAEPGTHQIVITRDFDAPRELVFKALTDPALVPQWWGPHRLTTTVDQMDVRFGGVWRYVQRDPEGHEFAFRGVYHDLVAPERVVTTFEFEPMAGHVLLETFTLEEHNGKTRMIYNSIFQSLADRDGMVQSGMEQGAAESWDRFDAVLKALQA